MNQEYKFRELLIEYFDRKAEGSTQRGSWHREQLNKQPHFIPIDIDALTATLSAKMDKRILSIMELQGIITDYYIGRTSGAKTKLANLVGDTLYVGSTKLDASNIVANTPAVVMVSMNPVGILYATESDSFYSARTLNAYLNSIPKVKKALRGSSLDLGHTIIDIAAQTPLDSRIQGSVSLLADADPTIIERHYRKLSSVSNSLSAQYTKLIKLHSKYGKKIDAVITKEFGLKASLINLNCNIVVLQESIENRQDYGKLEQAFANAARNMLMTMQFSRNIEEEIVHRVATAAAGKKAKSSKSVKKIPTVDIAGKVLKVGSTQTKTTSFKNLQTNRTIGLERLLTLINGHLHDVVSANMGDGNRRDVLNYRTGRLATSTKVERLTATRDGAITAFYSYMKYPYATFSEGGRQQYPRSRDPKLLITKSVREIAAQYVTNQLRAVNV